MADQAFRGQVLKLHTENPVFFFFWDRFLCTPLINDMELHSMHTRATYYCCTISISSLKEKKNSKFRLICVAPVLTHSASPLTNLLLWQKWPLAIHRHFRGVGKSAGGKTEAGDGSVSWDVFIGGWWAGAERRYPLPPRIRFTKPAWAQITKQHRCLADCGHKLFLTCGKFAKIKYVNQTCHNKAI